MAHGAGVGKEVRYSRKEGRKKRVEVRLWRTHKGSSYIVGGVARLRRQRRRRRKAGCLVRLDFQVKNDF